MMGMTGHALRARKDALRLPVKALAERAGLDEDNVRKVLTGVNDPRASTLAALDRALHAEEDAMRAYLDGLSALPLREAAE